MTFRSTLLIALCLLIVSCSSDVKDELEKIALRTDRYFSGKPIILTSKKIAREGEERHVYYAYRIIDHEITYDIQSTFSAISAYSALIRISCTAGENAKRGDLFSDMSEFQTDLGVISREASGFSTTQMAVDNSDFASESRWTIYVEYTYQNGNWIYNGIAGGPPSHSFINDLKTFPQNKRFRRAIGMSS